MRPLEAVLSGANLLALLALILPLPPTMRWLRAAALITPLIAVAQIAVEGQRWQMIPAYGSALILFLIGLFGSLLPGKPHTSLIAGSIGLGVLLMLLSIGLPLALPVFRFREPTGPYAIGTVTYHWVDPSRPELFTPDDPADTRELMAQVWYPAGDQPAAPRAPYLQDAARTAPALARLFHFPAFFFDHFKYVTTHAVTSAPAADGQSSYPVLIFLAGQNGFRQMNMFQVEELVSHGYIVVGLDQPGAAAIVRFPDGHEVIGQPREVMYPLSQQSVEPLPTTPTLFGEPMPEGIIPYFAGDVSFAIDQLTALNQADPNDLLTGRLDLERVGVFGMSLGGINAAEACLNDSRLKACLIMDVFMSAHVVKEGLAQPAMWITRDADTMRLERARAGGWTEQDIRQHQTTMRAVYENLRAEGYYLSIPNMFHLNLTDVPYWSPLLPQLGMIGPIDSQRVLNIVNTYTVAFFDQHLKGEPSPLLSESSSQYPEVIFETHQP